VLEAADAQLDEEAAGRASARIARKSHPQRDEGAAAEGEAAQLQDASFPHTTFHLIGQPRSNQNLRNLVHIQNQGRQMMSKVRSLS
jgi:hypothetical protein